MSCLDMNPFKQARLAGEVLLVRLGLVTIPFFPRRLVLMLSRLAGGAGYVLARKSRRIALANLDLAFKDSLTPPEKRRIARQAFSTMARTVLDMLWFSRHTAARLNRYLTLDPESRQRIDTAPVIGVTAHFGNWELLGRGLVAYGYPHAAVAAPLINPGVERLFNQSRMMSGMDIIPQAGAVRGLLKALKRKKHIALVLDQNIKPVDGGIFVNFFGLPIPMSSAPALLSARTGAPIIALFCLARDDGTYYVYVLPPLQPELFSSADATRTVTQVIADLFQQEIRKHPGQWLWMYKRWKHIPPGVSPAAYPFYAKPIRQG